MERTFVKKKKKKSGGKKGVLGNQQRDTWHDSCSFASGYAGGGSATRSCFSSSAVKKRENGGQTCRLPLAWWIFCTILWHAFSFFAVWFFFLPPFFFFFNVGTLNQTAIMAAGFLFFPSLSLSFFFFFSPAVELCRPSAYQLLTRCQDHS